MILIPISRIIFLAIKDCGMARRGQCEAKIRVMICALGTLMQYMCGGCGGYVKNMDIKA